MFAAGSRAEVTAPFKHANLPRFYLLVFFLVSRATQEQKKRPWRISEWKLGAAFRKEVRRLQEWKTKVRAAEKNWRLTIREKHLSSAKSERRAKEEEEEEKLVSVASFSPTQASLTKTAARLLLFKCARPPTFPGVRCMEGNSASAISQGLDYFLLLLQLKQKV